jgi:hypothetical protein
MNVTAQGSNVKKLANSPVLLAGIDGNGTPQLCYLGSVPPSGPSVFSTGPFYGNVVRPLRTLARLLCGVDDNGNIVPLQLPS